MSKLTSALNRARKLVQEKDRNNNSNLNQIVVCYEFNKPLNGELVIILNNNDEIPT